MTRRRYMRVVFALWGAVVVLAVVGWALDQIFGTGVWW